jgi:hypothetical protein
MDYPSAAAGAVLVDWLVVIEGERSNPSGIAVNEINIHVP